jgi:molybdopterin molybdotransferase
VSAVTFEQARACVVDQVARSRAIPASETVNLEAAGGRVLAQDAVADRDYPPVARSIRDGFAVRSSDVPGELSIVGEVRAGRASERDLAAGEAIEIMTGAPLPPGADAVVMIEHVIRNGQRVRVDRLAPAGQFINPRGAEARKGDGLLRAGKRLGFADIALLATIGQAEIRVYEKPRVSILATGDEIVPVSSRALPHQVRNSNAWALAVQVERAGGIPVVLPVAPDEKARTRELVEEGLRADLLLLSGGVSAGKYDLVEQVLQELGAEFFFDRVLIQPGQPLVFGRARDRFVFGLPGNPASTMVTFELFARAAVQILGGQDEPSLPLTLATLTQEFRHKAGLKRFLPACLSDGARVTPLPWAGSSDVPALARANAFLVADSDREHWKAGELISVLQKS